MSYIIRKIERGRWTGSDELGKPIKAQVVASCIVPKNSDLSVWFAESNSELENAKIAMLAAMSKPAAIDFVEFTVDEIKNHGFTIRETPSDAVPEQLKNLHRDICGLDLDSLKLFAQLIQDKIITKQYKRITVSEFKGILNNAIASGAFEKSDLNADLSRKI